MADTFIQLNTDGTGKKLDTRTEATNGEHRQVFVLGDPSTNAGIAPVDATAGLKVDLGADNDVTVSSSALPTGASTSANQTTIIGHLDGVEGLLTTIDTDTGNIDTKIGDISKTEDAAHSSGDKGVMSLGVRNDTMAALTGTDGDYTPIATTSTGRVQVSRTAHNNMVRGNATATNTADTSLVAAAGASTKNYITAVQVANSSSTNCVITLKDGSGGSTLGYVAAPANGGAIVYYDIPLVTSDNTALHFASNNSATTIYVSAQGYKSTT